MARAPAPVALALALAFFFALDASAVAPRRTWRTVVTPHFRVHYHEGEAALAVRAAELAEHALRDLSVLLGNLPEEPIHLVLTDETDSANGFAQTLPYDVIVLYAAVPEPIGSLSDYDDYLRMLLVHELSHVVHLDTVRGLPRAVNRIFGKIVSPNHVQPRWMIEGLATWLESYYTAGGRVRSALFDMILRAQVLADRFPRLDEITTYARDYPGGSAAYLYGGRLLDYIARNHGTEAIAEISNAYAARVLPYGINIVARSVTGAGFVDHWDAWVAEEHARARSMAARIHARGLRQGSKVLGLGESVRNARFGPRGELLLIDSPRDDDLELVIAEGLEPATGTTALALRGRVRRFRTSGGESAFTPDGQRLITVVSDVVQRRFRYRDLELLELDTGLRRRLTEGARLSEPDLAPDGRTIVAAAQGANRTWLVTLALDDEAPPRVVLPPRDGVQVFTPRWSPDGKRLAYAVMRRDGTRSIEVLELDGGEQRVLTRSSALDQSPVWSPDGRSIYFSSDRGNVFNIHRVSADGQDLVRVTNVLTGAFEPAIDPRGELLVFSLGTAEGFDLHALPLGARTFTADPAPLRPVSSATSTAIVYPEEPYAPWESLLPKAYFFDLFASSEGVALAATINGDDALAMHGYRLRLAFDSAYDRLGYSAVYVNRTQPTPINLSSSLTATRYAGSYLPSSGPRDQPISIWTARVGLDVPLGWWDVGSGLSFSYSVELRRALEGPPLDPFQPEPRSRGNLTLASVNASWYVSTTRGFEETLGNVEGVAFDVGLRLHHPALGSDLRVLELSSHLTGYLGMPWSRKQVLAGRLSAGISAGEASERSAYVLGGLPIRDVLSDALDNIRFGSDVLRGYAPGALVGRSFYLGTVEYRMMVFELERGIESLPFYADRLHLAVFVDAGDTPNGAPSLDGLRAGAGAELRLDLVAGYFLPLDLRLGYARGLTEDGIDDFYLVLGGAF